MLSGLKKVVIAAQENRTSDQSRFRDDRGVILFLFGNDAPRTQFEADLFSYSFADWNDIQWLISPWNQESQGSFRRVPFLDRLTTERQARQFFEHCRGNNEPRVGESFV